MIYFLQKVGDNINIILDHKLKTSEERSKYVENIINNNPNLSSQNLEYLANYILEARTQEEKKKKEILTDNRLTTINKRETSFENLISKFETNEDNVYSIFSNLGKSARLTQKLEITQEDIDNIPELKELIETIANLEEQFKAASGNRKYKLKKLIIELRQEQYRLKYANRNTVQCMHPSHSYAHNVDIYDDIYFDKNGDPHNRGPIDIFNPDHIRIIISNFAELKNYADHHLNSDIWALTSDISSLVEETLKKGPLLDIFNLRSCGEPNKNVKEYLEQKYNKHFSIERISTLWHNKIPSLLAAKASENYLMYYYTYVEYGKWKKCGCCGEIKLAHHYFFSTNPSSRDGWYSICKSCRSKKNKIKKGENINE